MKPTILSFFLLLIAGTSLIAQTTLKVEEYDLGERDLVFHAFGMNNKYVAGSIEESGEFKLDFSTFNIEEMQDAEVYLMDLKSAFSIYCDNEDEDQDEEKANEEGLDGMISGLGHLYIYNEERWMGLLIGASSQEIFDHINDEGYNDAVKGSYIEWYYASKDMKYSGRCVEKQLMYDNSEVEVVTSYELDLKKGINIILVEFLEVVEVQDAANMASEVRISSFKDYPGRILWYLKKF
ncbi:MAG: hypothetical protein CMP59_04575 [Flavobacteriales bacterium]|nr:hypothetical protein [Flavobacteriales bacterium]|tara:strand:- start:1802 stop:2512 length:711 start_codon:yes stop_codon:yes gene_type:complete